MREAGNIMINTDELGSGILSLKADGPHAEMVLRPFVDQIKERWPELRVLLYTPTCASHMKVEEI